MKDACYKKIKRTYKVFPSGRASQALAKCRRGKGQVRKSKKGAALKRWTAEKWVDTRTGKPCGAKTKKKQYCRPSKRVSSKTPKTTKEISPSQRRANIKRKSAGKRAKSIRRKKS